MKSEDKKTKLVAFALGELKGEEAKEVEALLTNDPDAKRYVDEVRAFSHFASSDLKGEPLPSGRGSSPVFKAIASRKKSGPTEKQIWLRAGAIAVVMILFFLAVPLRKKFSGNVAQIVPSTESSVEESSPRPTERTAKETASPIQSELDAFLERNRTWHSTVDCRASLPAALAGDKIQVDSKRKAISATYLFAESGAELSVKVSSALQPLLHEMGVVEVAREEPYTYFRRQLSEQELVLYKVPDNSRLPLCLVHLELEGKFSDATKTLLGAQLETMAKKMAESIEMEKR